MPLSVNAGVIRKRPRFMDSSDLSALKSQIISCGDAQVLVGRRENLDQHLDELFLEFSGESLIEYYHAELIVRMRRGQNLGSAFRDLWIAEGEFLVRNLRLRWLISACDSIMDDPGFDDAERALALAASMLAATVKLYETEHVALGVGQQARGGSMVQVMPLFDRMTTFSVGHGDLILNLLHRSRVMATKGSFKNNRFLLWFCSAV